MGNCFTRPPPDDMSPLRNGDSSSAEGAEAAGPARRTGGVVPPSGAPPAAGLPPPYQAAQTQPVVPPTQQQHQTQNTSRPSSQPVADKNQLKIARRIGLIQHLPTGIYDGSKTTRECVICMGDFEVGECLRYLPCMHAYHRDCIDDWLMRSFTCPSCMEPVDAALFATYYTTTA